MRLRTSINETLVMGDLDVWNRPMLMSEHDEKSAKFYDLRFTFVN